MTHPSFFALDALALGAGDEATTRHVSECPQCSGHVAAVRMPSAFPAALTSLATPQKRTRAPWGWALVGGVLATTLVLTVRLGGGQSSDATTPKGAPAARVWWKHGTQTLEWNGQKLSAGDAIRLEVAPAGFTRVTVFDEDGAQVLYDAKVEGSAPVLTPAWALDGHARQERLRVTLSFEDGGSPASVPTACGPSTPQQWCTQFSLDLEQP